MTKLITRKQLKSDFGVP